MSDVLLADSGSSKTDWAWMSDGKVVSRFQSVGLNPYFLSPDRITEEIRKALPAGFDQVSGGMKQGRNAPNKSFSDQDLAPAGCSAEY